MWAVIDSLALGEWVQSRVDREREHDGGPVRIAALPQAGIVGAERRALDERTHLVGRRSDDSLGDLPGDRPARSAE